MIDAWKERLRALLHERMVLPEVLTRRSDPDAMDADIVGVEAHFLAQAKLA